MNVSTTATITPRKGKCPSCGRCLDCNPATPNPWQPWTNPNPWWTSPYPYTFTC